MSCKAVCQNFKTGPPPNFHLISGFSRGLTAGGRALLVYEGPPHPGVAIQRQPRIRLLQHASSAALWDTLWVSRLKQVTSSRTEESYEEQRLRTADGFCVLSGSNDTGRIPEGRSQRGS